MGVKEYRIVWSTEEHAVIKAAAEKAGMTLKAFIAQAIDRAIRRTGINGNKRK